MCKFIQILSPSSLLHYIPFVERCFRKYSKYFQDDFIQNNCLNLESICPNFWIILDYSNNFMGFVYLDNFIGSNEKLFSAELTTCFDKKAWGIYTRYSAKIFLKKCFDEFGLFKIKAQIYPDNFRIRNLLKDCGFEYESTLKNETLRNGKPQDIEVYSLYRDYYYKTTR
ncbi:MAG: GNAT family N-acetyltransferase [Candidatus Gastranaerophilales bacterium]|nr:GNAT family N-acetyltransferase [Candidatus Gastranaerophilales bacterium]